MATDSLSVFDPQQHQPVLLATTTINCTNHTIYEEYARCQLRDDIEWRLQTFFSLFVVVYLAIFAKAISNLLIINRIRRRTRSANMNKINIVIALFALFEIVYCLDGPLQLIFHVTIPLDWHLLVEHLGIISINTILCLGGYVWIVTVFTAMLYNKHNKALNYAYFTLLGSNLIFIIFFIISYLARGLHDHQKMENVLETLLNLDYLCTALSTALNGIFFAISCLMVRGYLKKNLLQSQDKEGLLLSRLALAGLVIVSLRVLQNVLNIFDVPGYVKRNSITEENWGWAIYVFCYLTLVNVLPVLYFLKKYEPNPSQKVNEFIRTSDAEGISVKVIKSSDTDVFDKDRTGSLLVSSVFMRDEINEPLARSVGKR